MFTFYRIVNTYCVLLCAYRNTYRIGGFPYRPSPTSLNTLKSLPLKTSNPVLRQCALVLSNTDVHFRGSRWVLGCLCCRMAQWHGGCVLLNEIFYLDLVTKIPPLNAQTHKAMWNVIKEYMTTIHSCCLWFGNRLSKCVHHKHWLIDSGTLIDCTLNNLTAFCNTLPSRLCNAICHW